MAEHCRSFVRKTFQMVAWDNRYCLFNRFVQLGHSLTIPSLARARRHERSEGLQRSEAGDLVVRSLRQTHDCLQRNLHILIARGLAAPRRTIYDSLRSVNPYNRIIVIKKFCIIYMIEPQTTVGTFAGTALAQEHVALSTMGNNRSMDHHRVIRSREECI